MSIHVVWTANVYTDIYRPYIDMQWLKGLSFRRLLNVARVLSPEKDPSTRLCLDVTQVCPPWTLNLFFHVEWLQCLVQSHKNLCVDKALRKNELICNTYEYNSLKYNSSTIVHFLEAYAVTQGLSCRPWILTLLLNLKDQVNKIRWIICLAFYCLTSFIFICEMWNLAWLKTSLQSYWFSSSQNVLSALYTFYFCPIYLPLYVELQAGVPVPALKWHWTSLAQPQEWPGEEAEGKAWVEAWWAPVDLLTLLKPSTGPQRWFL